MELVWIVFIVVSACAVVMVGWVAYRNFLKLREQLEQTKAQLADKEEKEREFVQQKMKARREKILVEPVKAIAPPSAALEDHLLLGDEKDGQSGSAEGRGYLSQLNDPPYLSSINNPDIYHSVRPFDYWKHYQNTAESSNTDNQYHGYSRPNFVDSETLTNPITTQHSINWNNRHVSFQQCIRRFRGVQDSSATLKAREEANIDLLHLAQDFVDAAWSYGKIIISEHFLPPEKKTIQPQSLPGIIGGEKFVVHNILFKFAIDHKNIYGSDFAAAKAAGNELRGLMCYFNTSIPDLNVPLMALVDYRGFRLTAMSLLPVDTTTIIYGTFDAGKTIHYTQDDLFNARMKQSSDVMRLRPHICRQQQAPSPHIGENRTTGAGGLGFGSHSTTPTKSHPASPTSHGLEGFALYERERTPLLLTGKSGPKTKVRTHGATDELQLVTNEGTLVRRTSLENTIGPLTSSPPSSSSSSSSINLNVSFNNQLMYSAVDLEGHKGLDGKYYLLDFSRVLPPESPNRKFQNPHLSRLLRPEFLKTYDKMLCSDAFSGFIQGTPDEDEITADIHEATRYLRETHIPKMALRLYEMMKECKLEKPLDKFRLTEALHAVGINCRYAGILRKHTPDPECRQFVLAEVVARVVKNNLRWRLREQHQILKLPLEEPYLRLVIDYLNMVFGNTPKSDEYWDNSLKKDIIHNFEAALTEEEEDENFHLKPRIPITDIKTLHNQQQEKHLSITSTLFWRPSFISSSTDTSDQGDNSSDSESQPESSNSSSPPTPILTTNDEPSHPATPTPPMTRRSNDSLSSSKESFDGSGHLVTPRRQESPLSHSLRTSSASSPSINGGSRDSIRSSASPIAPSHHPHRRHSSIHRPLESIVEDSSSHSHSHHGGSGPSSFVSGRKLDTNFLTIVFNRVRAMMGLQFSHERSYSWDLEQPFNDTDLKNVGYKVKHMNIISHVQGFFWQINGLMARSSTMTGLAQEYYKSAIDKYEESLDLNPENKDILRNLALTWLLLIEEDTKPGHPFSLDDHRVRKVQEYIMRAISAPPKYDSLSLFRFANLLSRLNRNEEAEDYYLQSLEADPNNTGCLHEYGEFLFAQGLHDEAEQFYRRSSETTAGAQRFPENYY